MCIWIPGGHGLVNQEADDGGSHAGGVDVPFAQNPCDRLVQAEHEVISKTHGEAVEVHVAVAVGINSSTVYPPSKGNCNCNSVTL